MQSVTYWYLTGGRTGENTDNHFDEQVRLRRPTIEELPMHLTSDYIHPTPRGGKCRIRVYLSEEEQDALVVICSELPNNGGSSVTYCAHQIAAEVIHCHRLPIPVWIEHYPPETTDGTSETFELVVFSSYEIKERAPYLGEIRLTIGEPIWKPLDRQSVETLVGSAVGCETANSSPHGV